MDYFHLFYEYFEEKVSDFLFVKSGSEIIFFWHNLVASRSLAGVCRYMSARPPNIKGVSLLVRFLIL